MKLNSPEYNALKRFLGAIWKEAWGDSFPSDFSPMDSLMGLEQKFPGKAGVGLNSAIDDTLARIALWPKAKVQTWNQLLRDNEIITIGELRIRRAKKVQKILKRGWIEGEDECLFLKSLLDENCDDKLGGGQISEISTMVELYEARPR